MFIYIIKRQCIVLYSTIFIWEEYFGFLFNNQKQIKLKKNIELK